MISSELVGRLAKLYPNQLGKPEQATAWGHEYQRALGQFQGQKLDSAYNHVMAGWDKLTFPKPGDFAKACGGYSSYGDGPTMVERIEYMEREGPPLVESSVDDGMRRFEEMFGTSYEPEGDIEYIAKRLIWSYLQARFLVEHPKAPAWTEEVFLRSGERWKLTDEELADVKGRLDTRISYTHKWNKVR